MLEARRGRPGRRSTTGDDDDDDDDNNNDDNYSYLTKLQNICTEQAGGDIFVKNYIEKLLFWPEQRKLFIYSAIFLKMPKY